MEALDQPAEECRNAARQFCVAFLSVGIASAVGSIDDGRIGQELQRRLEHRQPAHSGIEEEEGGIRVHITSLREAQLRSNPVAAKLECCTPLAMAKVCVT